MKKPYKNSYDKNAKAVGKTYQDYLKDGNNFNKSLLASKGAHAVRTRGFNAGYEFKQETIAMGNKDKDLFKFISYNGDILMVKHKIK